MDETEFDLYGDLDNFNLGEQVKEKNALVSNLEEKLRLAKEKIEALEQQNKSLCEEKMTLERNMSSLMKTAKAELSRKNNQIKDLRQEKDNICFRRFRQRSPHRMEACSVETESKETLTDLSYAPSQRLDANLMPAVKVEKLNDNKGDHVATVDQHRKRKNPFSDRKTANRPTNNNRNDFHIDPPKDDGRSRVRGRAHRHEDVRDDDKRQLRVERSSKRKRSRERSPADRKERSKDYSRERERKRVNRSDEERSGRRNAVRDKEGHADSIHPPWNSITNGNDRSKRARRHCDRRNGEETKHKSTERCDIILEPKESGKEKSPKRKSSEKSTIAVNEMAASTEIASQKHTENIAPRRNKLENGKVKLEAIDTADKHSLNDDQMETEDGELVDSLEYVDRKTNSIEDLHATVEAENGCENDGIRPQQILSLEIKKEPKIEIITEMPAIVEPVNHTTEQIKGEIVLQETMTNDIENADAVKTEDFMKMDAIQTTPHDEDMPADVLGEPMSIEIKPFSTGINGCGEVKMEAVAETANTVDNDSVNVAKANDEPHAVFIHDIVDQNGITTPSQPTENHTNYDIITPKLEKNEVEMHAPAVVNRDGYSPNRSLSKSVKNVSTASTDYQIVDDDDEEVIIYVTRKKVKKPKKEKHRSKEKDKQNSKEAVV